jgi:cytochrome c oxidase subunit 4
MSDRTIEESEHEAQSQHIIPPIVYLKVFGVLMALMILTCAIAALDLGFLNTLIALTIAVTKATFIVLYFMHIKFSSKLVKTFSVAALFWLSILFALTLQDYFTRHGMQLPQF